MWHSFCRWCYGNQLILGANKYTWLIPLRSLCNQFKTNWNIAIPMHTLTALMILIHRVLRPFNGLFSSTSLVSRHQKCKLFWILMKQEMMGWQWHQLDPQIIGTSLQTDNHATTSPLSFLQVGCPSSCHTNSIKAWRIGIVNTKHGHAVCSDAETKQLLW